jgi:hypothetical protein
MYKRVSIEWHRYHDHKSWDSPPLAKSQGRIVQATQPTAAKDEQEKVISRRAPHFALKNRRIINDYSHEEPIQRPSKRRQAYDY